MCRFLLPAAEEVGSQIQTCGTSGSPPIVQQIPCDLRPQRRVPASQLKKDKRSRKKSERGYEDALEKEIFNLKEFHLVK